ncbi:MAG: hypothetical protein IPN09_07510 [Bacteroidetes bacterium]|nr:hypothetical protein [Bacteroidota bacterium]
MNFNPNASFFGVFDYNGTQITKTLAKVGFDAIKKEYTLKVILTNITYNTPISISLFNHCNENITFDIITPPFQFSPIFNLVKDSCTTVDGLTYIKSGSSCEFQGRINYPVNFCFQRCGIKYYFN